MEYICDKCKGTIEVNKEIKCCPMCGTNCIRDTGKPIKQLIVAQCSVVGRVKFVQHPDGHKEFVDFLNGDKTISKLLIEIISNLKYQVLSWYFVFLWILFVTNWTVFGRIVLNKIIVIKYFFIIVITFISNGL